MKTVLACCYFCGAEVLCQGRTGFKSLEAIRRGRPFCSAECRDKWVSRSSSERMAKTNRKHASARMTERNPMAKEETREKVSASLKRLKHCPRVRGGNGRGLTVAQGALATELGWPTEHIVPTRTGKGSGYPTHYKLDLAEPASMVAVEVDGRSHCAIARQEQDHKKDAFLASLGWIVLRFTNQEVLSDAKACAQAALAATSRDDRRRAA